MEDRFWLPAGSLVIAQLAAFAVGVLLVVALAGVVPVWLGVRRWVVAVERQHKLTPGRHEN